MNSLKKTSLGKRNREKLIFYLSLVIIPTIQFLLFYVYVNFNTIVLAFQNYTQKVGEIGYDIKFAGFANFAAAFRIFAEQKESIINSISLYSFDLVVISVLSLLFSYYVAKNYKFSGFFQVILFLPQLLSSVVMILIYKGLLDYGFPNVMGKIFNEEWLINKGLEGGPMGINASSESHMAAIMFFTIFTAFGTKCLIYAGSMSGIDMSIVESAQLDGVNAWQEFVHIYMPSIWPIIITFVVTSFTGIFTSTFGMLIFYGDHQTPPINFFGFYLYMKTAGGALVTTSAEKLSYSVLSAMGIIITALVVPAVLGVKKLMHKLGPSED